MFYWNILFEVRQKSIIRKFLKCLNPCFTGIYSLSWWQHCSVYLGNSVLILVLLEYTLWEEYTERITPWKLQVLILVLLEYTLWGWVGNTDSHGKVCLNPCFIGIYSLRSIRSMYKEICRCLNPCFIGIYSLSWWYWRRCFQCYFVLILVLLEYTLWVCGVFSNESTWASVLILVLLEYTLWEDTLLHLSTLMKSS